MPKRRPFVMLVAIALIAAISAAIAPTAAAVTQPPKTATATAPTVHHYPSPSTRHSFKPRPTFRKKIFPIRRRSGVSRPKRPKPITYHGGPVMTGETHLYLIWYGSWDGNSASEILTDFANSLGGSPYYAINASYMQMDFSAVSGDLKFAGEIADAYSHGTRLTDTDVRRIVGMRQPRIVCCNRGNRRVALRRANSAVEQPRPPRPVVVVVVVVVLLLLLLVFLLGGD